MTEAATLSWPYSLSFAQKIGLSDEAGEEGLKIVFVCYNWKRFRLKSVSSVRISNEKTHKRQDSHHKNQENLE